MAQREREGVSSPTEGRRFTFMMDVSHYFFAQVIPPNANLVFEVELLEINGQS